MASAPASRGAGRSGHHGFPQGAPGRQKDISVYNLNGKRISPSTLLRPNDLVTRTHYQARLAGILSDERLQVTTDTTGATSARLVQVPEAA